MLRAFKASGIFDCSFDGGLNEGARRCLDANDAVEILQTSSADFLLLAQPLGGSADGLANL
jgi:hypothetical protein